MEIGSFVPEHLKERLHTGFTLVVEEGGGEGTGAPPQLLGLGACSWTRDGGQTPPPNAVRVRRSYGVQSGACTLRGSRITCYPGTHGGGWCGWWLALTRLKFNSFMMLYRLVWVAVPCGREHD